MRMSVRCKPKTSLTMGLIVTCLFFHFSFSHVRVSTYALQFLSLLIIFVLFVNGHVIFKINMSVRIVKFSCGL